MSMVQRSIGSPHAVRGGGRGDGTLGTVDSGFQDGDHPETASDLDESELRRELLNDKWRMLFDKYDPEGFGEIPWEDFLQVLKNPEFIAEVDANKREILSERAQERKTSAITFQEFVNVNPGARLRVARAEKFKKNFDSLGT